MEILGTEEAWCIVGFIIHKNIVSFQDFQCAVISSPGYSVRGVLNILLLLVIQPYLSFHDQF